MDRKLITNITIDGLDYELIHVPKEVKDVWEKTKQPIPEFEDMPLLSLNDLISVWDIDECILFQRKDKNIYKKSSQFKSFDKLAKSKLNS